MAAGSQCLPLFAPIRTRTEVLATRWSPTAWKFCWREIAALNSTEFHTLMPAITFLEHAPDRTRAEHELQRIAARLLQPGVIELDAYAEGYVQKPLDWAPTPQSFCH